jgi:phosphatidate cytidylyltransferase
VIVYFGSPVSFLLLVTVITMIALAEFYRLLTVKGLPCWRWFGIACGGALPMTFYLAGFAHQGAVAAVVILSFLVGLWARQDLLLSLQSLALTLLGIFYIGWLFSYVFLLRMLSDGPAYVFYLFTVVWLGDAAALIVGRVCGRHKLAPRLSPGKTIEGAIGGFLGSLCGATLGGRWLLGHLTLTQCVTLACLLAVFGQLGDLSESLVKRSAGVKDSGGLIPGHGGILDKIDGILFGAPVLYYYILYVVGREFPS